MGVLMHVEAKGSEGMPPPILIKYMSEIASEVGSGIARTPSMLGHSMGTLRLYELLRKVQKHLGAWGMLSQNFTASQIGSEAIP